MEWLLRSETIVYIPIYVIIILYWHILSAVLFQCQYVYSVNIYQVLNDHKIIADLIFRHDICGNIFKVFIFNNMLGCREPVTYVTRVPAKDVTDTTA